MKSFKKLAALIASLALCTSTMISITGNAIALSFDKNSDEYQQFFDGYTEVDDSGLFESWWYRENPNPLPYKFYAKENCYYIYEEFDYDNFSFTVVSSSDENEIENKIQSILDTFNPSYTVTHSINTANKTITYYVTDNNISSDTLRNAKVICTELKEQGIITDFVYSGDISHLQIIELLTDETPQPYITRYRDYTTSNQEELKELFENYITENNLECEVSFNGDNSAVYVVPNNDTSLESQFKVAKQILDGTGYFPTVLSPASEEKTFSNEYDLYNAVYGDLNEDTNVTPVDASLLLNYYAGAQSDTERESDNAIEFIGDMNNDGNITPIDAALILEQYADEQTSSN